MKSILMSIQPKWCELIASGKKTIEVRKTAPKEVPFKVYIYCTGVKNLNLTEYTKLHRKTGGAIDYWHGKVVAEFVCNAVESIPVDSEAFTAISKPSCLTTDELIEYCSGRDMYGLHITALKVYDEPRELGEFFCYNKELEKRFLDGENYCCYDAKNEYGEAMTECDGENIKNCYHCWEEWSGWCHRITRPPQNYIKIMEVTE